MLFLLFYKKNTIIQFQQWMVSCISHYRYRLIFISFQLITQTKNSIFFVSFVVDLQVLVVQSPAPPSLQIKEQPPSPGSPSAEMYSGGTQIYLQVKFLISTKSTKKIHKNTRNTKNEIRKKSLLKWIFEFSPPIHSVFSYFHPSIYPLSIIKSWFMWSPLIHHITSLIYTAKKAIWNNFNITHNECDE